MIQDVIHFVPLSMSSQDHTIELNDGVLEIKIVGVKLKSAIDVSVTLISNHILFVFCTYHVRGSNLYQLSHEITLVQFFTSPLVLPTIRYCPSDQLPRVYSVISAHDAAEEIV